MGKNHLTGTVIAIYCYCVFQFLPGRLTAGAQIQSAVCAAFNGTFLILAVSIARMKKLTGYLGLTIANTVHQRALWYLPLLLVSTGNLWYRICGTAPEAVVFPETINLLLAAALEEILFRGMLYRALQEREVRHAALICSTAFALAHLLNAPDPAELFTLPVMGGAVMAFFAGLLFAAAFQKTGSLILCIAAHGIINITSLFIASSNSTVWICQLLLLMGAAWFYSCNSSFSKKNGTEYDL